MAAVRWPVDRLVEEVALLGTRALPRDEYFRELAARLRRVVDSDATCWHTLDPGTGLMTSDAPDELISAGVFTAESAATAGAGIVASEYIVDDVNTFAELAKRRLPVATLCGATRGHPQRSTRYQEILAPAGIPFELRAAFVSRGRPWGAVHMARREEHGDFSGADVAALGRLAGIVAEGIRTSLRFDAARRAGGAGPGMIVVGRRDEVELITDSARELLAEIRSPAVADQPLPTALLALAASMRAGAATNAVSVPGGSGWITLHASLPDGRGAGRVAVVVDRAAGRDSASLRLETYGVTAREREVATLLAQGCSNAEIASALVVSPYTVQDHIKNLFEKTGVSSRRELVARIFLDDYLPSVIGGAPLSASGGFAPASAGAARAS